ncbi:hypothetical protein [Moritella sp. Urea-trap-13]|uniref:hypothetical protein n=1 Tax=Moritella sp. Urea-trap-13 TaxID=2058327 RepID=UPI000C336D91|nr:hypothetical protein [Moritella sp. Urea-trap-13]PKH04967.1 hypothetical protein CXF93_19380 [Moritella sp. Urea-trap-13]
MKKAFILLPLAAACASQFVMADTTDSQRLAQLEQELAILQEAISYDSLSDRMSINGFFTGKVGVASNDAGYNGYDKEADFSEGSKLGIQGSFALTEQTKIVAQLVARGSDDWSTEMEWAFLSHDFDNGFVTRIGRLRVPLYMYSDYLEVGYAQPWASPPSELYSIVPLSSFDGVDVIYDFELGEVAVALQASYGHADRDTGETLGEVDYEDILGASASFSYEEWVFRTTYYQTTLNTTTPGQLGQFFDNEQSYFAGVGLSYDNGSLLAISEFAVSDVEGQYSDTQSGYITLGYRISDFTPYVTYAFLETTDDSERVNPADGLQKALFDWQRTAYSVGTRYDISSNLALKADVTYATDFGDTSGGLTSNIVAKNDDTIVYTVSFDAVF